MTATTKTHWRPPRDLDPACRLLCIELNKLPGITTTGSCEGHGRQPPFICFRAASLRALEPLARAVDPRYYGQAKNPWRVELTETDAHHDRAMFQLTCEGIPRRRKKHLDLLAECIEHATSVLDHWAKRHWCDRSCAKAIGYADVPAALKRRRLPPNHLMIGGIRVVRRRDRQWEVRRRNGKTAKVLRTRKAAVMYAHDVACDRNVETTR